MRRWRRPRYEDEDEEEGEEVEEEERPRRRIIPPARPMRVTRFSDFGLEDEESETGIQRFDKIEPMIRRGMYKPKTSDPWMAHVLYENLRALGEIK